jgi:hypothetical protein
MPSSFPRPLLIFPIILSLGFGSVASARPICAVGPGRSAPPVPDVTSSLPGQSALLDFAASVNVPGIERFSAAGHFLENQPPEQLQITWLGQNFRKHFLRKVEADVSATELDMYRLRRSAHDDDIVAELGKRPETNLYVIWTLLSCQPQGEKGALLTNATPNIFYVQDPAGATWSVDAVWGGAGWEIGASSLDDPRPWGRGRQVISRSR